MFEGLGNLAACSRSFRNSNRKWKVQAKLEQIQVEGSAGGGMVRSARKRHAQLLNASSAVKP